MPLLFFLFLLPLLLLLSVLDGTIVCLFFICLFLHFQVGFDPTNCIYESKSVTMILLFEKEYRTPDGFPLHL